MSEGSLAGIERELKVQTALLRLVNRDAIERERAQVLSDPVSEALLWNAHAPIEAGPLKEVARKASGQSPATISRRLTDLVERGLLERSGSGGRVTYIITGLIVP